MLRQRRQGAFRASSVRDDAINPCSERGNLALRGLFISRQNSHDLSRTEATTAQASYASFPSRTTTLLVPTGSANPSKLQSQSELKDTTRLHALDLPKEPAGHVHVL